MAPSVPDPDNTGEGKRESSSMDTALPNEAISREPFPRFQEGLRAGFRPEHPGAVSARSR